MILQDSFNKLELDNNFIDCIMDFCYASLTTGLNIILWKLGNQDHVWSTFYYTLVLHWLSGSSTSSPNFQNVLHSINYIHRGHNLVIVEQHEWIVNTIYFKNLYSIFAVSNVVNYVARSIEKQFFSLSQTNIFRCST